MISTFSPKNLIPQDFTKSTMSTQPPSSAPKASLKSLTEDTVSFSGTNGPKKIYVGVIDKFNPTEVNDVGQLLPPRTFKDVFQGDMGNCDKVSSLKLLDYLPHVVRPVVVVRPDKKVEIELAGADGKVILDSVYQPDYGISKNVYNNFVLQALTKITYGSDPATTIQMLTGNKIEVYDNKLNLEEQRDIRFEDEFRAAKTKKMTQLIRENIKPGDVLLLGTTYGSHFESSPLRPRHTYFGYLEKNGKNFVLINPHRGNEEVKVPFKKMGQYLTRLVKVTNEPYKKLQLPELY